MLQNDKGHFNYDYLGGKKIPYIFIHTCKANKKAIDIKSVFTKVNKLQIPLTL